MRVVLVVDLLYIEAISIILHTDLVAGNRTAGRNAHNPSFPDTDTVFDRIFHQGLDRQRRQGKAVVLNVIFHVDVLKAQHLDLCIDPGVLQLLTKGNQPVDTEGFQILPKIGTELLRHLTGPFRVPPT